MPQLTVHITRAFEGPRHDRLHAIWETIAEFWADHLRLAVWPNPGARLSHAQMFNRMWTQELQQDNQYAILTEHDFLPDLNEPTWYEDLQELFEQLDLEHGKQFAGLACEYCTRGPATKQLVHKGTAGGWWVLIDKSRFNDRIDFHGKPDPCNQLEAAIGGVYLCEGTDAYPEHYGIKYPYGEHLFWSRHLHDAPERRVSGFHLGDIQHRHDVAVERWLREAPDDFRTLLESRHAHVL